MSSALPSSALCFYFLWGWVKTDYSHGIDGPNRNRWFTVLKHGESFHGYVSHNQRVYIYKVGIEPIICHVIPQTIVYYHMWGKSKSHPFSYDLVPGTMMINPSRYFNHLQAEDRGSTALSSNWIWTWRLYRCAALLLWPPKSIEIVLQKMMKKRHGKHQRKSSI